ncbi:MAG: DUF2953 domain-containing protein [Ruminococcaceae bacterium]|nr:DUF2953 domain-containing protein [Oscillospiraceae bacterium]
MTALYIILGVIAFIALVVGLLNIPLIIKGSYSDSDNKVRLSIHYLWFRYVLMPDEESNKYLKEEKLLKKGKKLKYDEDATLEGIYKSKGIAGFIDVVKVSIKNTWNLLKSFIEIATIKDLQVKMNIVGEDAADTAIIYGYANSVIYPIVGAVLSNANDVKKYNVNLNADFSEGADSSIDISILASVKITKAVMVIAEHGVEAENLLITLGKNPKHAKEN